MFISVYPCLLAAGCFYLNSLQESKYAYFPKCYASIPLSHHLNIHTSVKLVYLNVTMLGFAL